MQSSNSIIAFTIDKICALTDNKYYLGNLDSNKTKWVWMLTLAKELAIYMNVLIVKFVQRIHKTSARMSKQKYKLLKTKRLLGIKSYSLIPWFFFGTNYLFHDVPQQNCIKMLMCLCLYTCVCVYKYLHKI